jgi:hypothetical protein
MAQITYDDKASGGPDPTGQCTADDMNEIKTVVNSNAGLTANTTVNIPAASTAAETQALIDAQPKALNGYTLTFQFADGTYTLDTRLTFAGFCGGKLLINGNPGENQGSLHTNQAVFLNFNNGTDGLFIEHCCWIDIRNLKIFSTARGAYAQESGGGFVHGCYFLSNVTTGDVYGFNNYLCAPTYVAYNYFEFITYCIGVFDSRVFSFNNDDTGATGPRYGLQAKFAATIGKDGTQPAGSSANELTTPGSVIR